MIPFSSHTCWCLGNLPALPQSGHLQDKRDRLRVPHSTRSEAQKQDVSAASCTLHPQLASKVSARVEGQDLSSVPWERWPLNFPTQPQADDSESCRDMADGKTLLRGKCSFTFHLHYISACETRAQNVSKWVQTWTFLHETSLCLQVSTCIYLLRWTFTNFDHIDHGSKPKRQSHLRAFHTWGQATDCGEVCRDIPDAKTLQQCLLT